MNHNELDPMNKNSGQVGLPDIGPVDGEVSLEQCEQVCAHYGSKGSGYFLHTVIKRAKTLMEHRPGADPEEAMKEAFRQVLDREQFLTHSQDEEAVTFRRMLMASVYEKLNGKRGEVLSEVERIAQEQHIAHSNFVKHGAGWTPT